ncbi:Hypothetical_protein [Hexamita inflata]|uniref:Hypothetical_protein n=1 Tax=Hexamita inflata TaxID=28002 RepID=A0AA86RF64_9EUKA|nr:Hypothetical protein HINF_LOCUS61258 [Hexamita inflata]
MFKYSQTDCSLEIKINIGQKQCQNNLSQFYGKNFNNVVIDGGLSDIHSIKQTEFLLRSYNQLIDKLEIKNCIINLDLAIGFFQQIIFTNCKFYGALSNQFHAISLNFFCVIKLSSLAAGDIEQINLTELCEDYSSWHQIHTTARHIQESQQKIEYFADIQYMKNLNKLSFENIAVDLSQLDGLWNQVLFFNCGLNNNLRTSFRTEIMKIESRDPNVLCFFKDRKFNNMQLKFRLLTLINPQLLQQMSWQAADLVFECCQIDLHEFAGHFINFEAHSCNLMNSFTKQFRCDNLLLSKCTSVDSLIYSSNILKNIHCKSVCTVVSEPTLILTNVYVIIALENQITVFMLIITYSINSAVHFFFTSSFK